ncbi:phosphotransferase [Mycolicibacterium sp. 050158]|uniref:phosphotransferase n=1 Tax=Mycolicibacterium sp. 050158 TaxID=3090602 RepID=UPI00299F1BED|nr:phosphotransferase [Mycolicibacterium sp. 050158]MDX1888030.1 phosphotransferase [Mycolicibacterium sp. 050158]
MTSFTESFERLDAEQIRPLLNEVYGVEIVGTPIRLPTERDDTYRVATPLGDGYVVKVAHPGDHPRIVDLQVAALLHVGRQDPRLPLERILCAVDGQRLPSVEMRDGRRRIMRVTTFLPGRTLRSVEPSPGQLRQCGRVLARMANALNDFDHEAADRHLMFDLQNFGELAAMRRLSDTPAVRWVFDWFESVFQSAAAELPKQVVHGDFSLDNILVDPGADTFVQGVLDWGDVMRSWRAADLASGLASQVAADGDAWERPRHMIDGYREECAMTDAESELIRGMVAMRVAQRLLMALHLSAAMPENAEYLSRNVEWSAAQLSNLVDA